MSKHLLASLLAECPNRILSSKDESNQIGGLACNDDLLNDKTSVKELLRSQEIAY